MSDQLISGVFTVATAIVGVAIIALILSKNANTPAVLNSAGTAFSGALSTALSPVTGSSSFGSFSGLSGNLG